MPKVFISYSRKDIEFARNLAAELQKRDMEFWVDWEGIPPTVDWMKEIEKGIEGADAFLFLISPDSAKSKACASEIEHAVKNGKRIIPLVVREIQAEETPAHIGHLNYIFFSQAEDFETTFNKLMAAIETDYEWVHEHTRLLGRALEWDASGRNSNLLLRGPNLDNAQLWLAKAGAVREPKPLLLHGEYIQESRRDAIRRMRITQGIGAAFIILMLAATVVSFIGFRNASIQRDKAVIAEGKAVDNAHAAATAQSNAETNLAESERLRLSLEAKQILEEPLGNAELAALLSLQALNSKYVPQADVVLDTALTRIYTLQAYRGHEDAVGAVAFSPDGQLVLTGSDDHTARLWQLATGKEVLQFTGHKEEINSVAVSPDGNYVLTGSDDKTARLWNAKTGKELLVFEGHQGKVNSVAFSVDGKYALTGSSDATARLWSIATGKEVLQFVGHEDKVNSVAFSLDGKYVATGSDDKTARLWNAATGEEIRQFIGNTREVMSVAFSPDGKYLAAGSDTNARLFDVATGEEVREFIGHADRVRSVAFSRDGKYILTGSSDTTARLWDVETGQELRKFTGHVDSIRSVAFSPDGRYVLTGGLDHVARLWDADLNQASRQFIGHTNAIFAVAFSPDGKSVLTGSADNSARLWDAATNREIRRFVGHTNWILSVAFSPSGEQVLTGSKDGTALLWDTSTGQQIRAFTGHTGEIYSVAFSPDGRFILTGSEDKVARLWDAETGKEVREFTGHKKAVKAVAFSPDGKYVLTGSNDTTAKLWDASTAKELQEFSGHTNEVKSVAFSPDGKYVLTGSDDKTARLWDAATGKEIREFEGHVNQVKSVAFSPDGKYVLTGSDDTTARLWDAATGEEIRSFTAHTEPVRAVAFSPDGKYVLTGSVDKTARLWDTDYRATMLFACAHLVRDLSDKERTRYLIHDNTPVCDPAMTASIVVATAPPIPVPTALANVALENAAQEPKKSYVEEFDNNLDNWNQFLTTGIARQVDAAIEGGSLKVKLSLFEDKVPWVYWVNNSLTYTNVQLQVVTTNNGNNANGVTLVCQYNEAGWYEFTVSNSGFYSIAAYDPTLRSYEAHVVLAAGGSSAIRTGKVTNTYMATCKGSELTLTINDTVVKTITDHIYKFTEGSIGIGVSSPNTLPVDVQLESLSVNEPK